MMLFKETMELIYNFWVYLLIFLFGSAWGSFLNVLVLRTHDDQVWWKGRSHCPKCGKELHALELIPLISYVLQKGKCKGCGANISIQYPLVELASAFLAITCYYLFGFSAEGFIVFVAAWLLLGNFVSDLLFMELPEIFNYSLLLTAALYQFFVVHASLLSIFIGALFGFLFFYLQFILSKKQGIGEGDIRLGVIIGVFLAWPLTIYSILTSYIVATLFFLPLIIMKKISMKTAVPLGVFLLPVLLVFLLFKSEVISIINTFFIFPLSWSYNL